MWILYTPKRLDSVEDERKYLIEALQSFRDGEIHNEELEDRLIEVDFEEETGLHNLIDCLYFH